MFSLCSSSLGCAQNCCKCQFFIFFVCYFRIGLSSCLLELLLPNLDESIQLDGCFWSTVWMLMLILFDAGELNSLFSPSLPVPMASIVKYRFRQYFYYPRSTLIMFGIAASVPTNSDDEMNSCAMPINSYCTIRLRRTSLKFKWKGNFT